MNTFCPVIVVGVIMTQFGNVALLEAQQPMDELPHYKALGMIESGCNDYAVGLKGERSRYQFSKATWQEHSNRPFSFAYRTDFATEAAKHYSNRLRNIFSQDRHMFPTDEEFYVMWNWGPRKFKAVGYDLRRVPHVVFEAAQRFSNLVYMYKNNN